MKKNIIRCSDKGAYNEMIDRVKIAMKNKDSVGGAIEIRIKNPPKGIGEPVFDKLDAKLAQAFMSIGAVKAVGIGEGTKVEGMFGSEYNDLMTSVSKKVKHLSNHEASIQGLLILCDVASGEIKNSSDLSKYLVEKGELTNFEPRSTMTEKLQEKYSKWKRITKI